MNILKPLLLVQFCAKIYCSIKNSKNLVNRNVMINWHQCVIYMNISKLYLPKCIENIRIINAQTVFYIHINHEHKSAKML